MTAEIIDFAPYAADCLREERVGRYVGAFLRFEAQFILLAPFLEVHTPWDFSVLKVCFRNFINESDRLSKNLQGVRSYQNLRRCLPGVRLQASKIILATGQVQKLPPVLSFSRFWLIGDMYDALGKMRMKLSSVLPAREPYRGPKIQFVPTVADSRDPEPA